VLFEMLAGVRAFPGHEVAEVLAGVIKDEPRWESLPPRTSPVLLRLLRRCLQKDPRRRLQHIGDAQFDLDESAGAPAGDSTVRGRSGERLAWAVLAILLSAAAVISWFFAPGSTTPVANELRFEVGTPPTTDPLSLAISPDGRNLVFAADNDGRSKLWLHALNELSSRPLAGTDGGFYPFWSPDGRSIGFFSGGKLNRLDLEGGLVRPITNAPNPVGGSWGRDGAILFAPNFTGPIFRVAATGGAVAQVTRTDENHSSHRFPLLLPDGRHFLYYVPGGEASRGVYVASLDGGSDTRLLGDADAPAVFVPPRRLIFVSAGKLLAQPFDPQTRTLSGTPSPVADQVVAVGDSSQAGLSASAAGALVYRSGAGKGQRQLIWFDRAGKPIGTAADPDDAGVEEPSISPDGRHVGISRTVNGNTDVWMVDLDRRLLIRFTYDGAAEAVPIWSPDGTKVVFNSNRGGRFNLYLKAASGSGVEDLLLRTEQNKAPVDWSPDGRHILFRSPSLSTGFDLWALPLEGKPQAFPVVQTMFEERDGQFSPDGNWIAYQSNESGRMEIFIQSFPGPGGKIQVSTGGGAQVRWRKDGRELFYIALDGKLMAVPIRPSADGRSIEAATPVALFATRVGGAIRGTYLQQYVVSPKGDRFLMNTVTSEASVAPVTVILNWRPPSTP
jgi:Tol biopolymer transport system component